MPLSPVLVLLVLQRVLALDSRLERLDAIAVEEAPFLALVLCSNSKYFCTGTIVNELWVLTAAHCFYDTEGTLTEDNGSVLVVAGTSKLSNAAKDIKSGAAQIRKSEKIRFHDSYRFSENFLSDLALVFITEPIDMTNRTLIAPLEPNYNAVHAKKEKITGESSMRCTVYGYGKVYLNEDNVNDDSLKKHAVDVGKNCPCLNGVWSIHWRSNVMEEKILMCEEAGQGAGLCSGDQGGPMICDNFLYGIATAAFHYRDLEECRLSTIGPNECGSTQTLYTYTDLCPFNGWLAYHVPKYPFISEVCA